VPAIAKRAQKSDIPIRSFTKPGALLIFDLRFSIGNWQFEILNQLGLHCNSIRPGAWRLLSAGLILMTRHSVFGIMSN
jgi:hypothetical protein